MPRARVAIVGAVLSFTIGEKLPIHPQYRNQRTMRDFWRRSDRARFDYAVGADAAGREILPKHEREDADRYNRRRIQAMPRRYTRPIVDRYNDFVTRETTKRAEAQPGTPYGVLLSDADGCGTPLPTLLKRALRKAQVEGVSYLLCDSNTPESYESAAQEQQAGKRGILRLIEADSVIWWRYWQGSLAEATVLLSDEAGDMFAWYVNATFTRQIRVKAMQESPTAAVEYKIVSVGPEQTHRYGRCPLVPLNPVFDDECAVGEDSQAAPLAEQQKRICNIDTWLYEELQGATFTMTAFLGVSADEVKDVKVGPGMGVALPGSNGKTPAVQRIGSDVAQADSLRKQLDYEIRETYRVAGLTSGNPLETGAPESGVAKAFAFNEVEAKLAALSDAAELCENRAIACMASAHGFAYPGDCDWPDEFATPELADEIEMIIRMQAASLPAVLQRAQIERFAALGFNLTGEQKAQLATELDAQVNVAAKVASNPVINPAARTPGT